MACVNPMIIRLRLRYADGMQFPAPLSQASTRRQWLQAALFSLPTLANAQAQAKPDFSLGAALPWSQVPLLHGEVLTAAQLRGQVLVMYFWASWCPFCAQQSPEIEQLFKTHHGKGLYVLGVSIDKQADTARAHLHKKDYHFPSTWADPDRPGGLQKPKGLPVVIVYNRQSQLVQLEQGQMFPEDIQALKRWI